MRLKAISSADRTPLRTKYPEANRSNPDAEPLTGANLDREITVIAILFP
jgi:hypothetical protein